MNFEKSLIPLFISGWKMGLEPTASGTTIQRSNQLNYIHHLFRGCKYNILFFLFKKIYLTSAFDVNFDSPKKERD
jgi:hypothetical protein